MTAPAVLRTELPGVPVRRGKVRDVYTLGDWLLLVSTDRISAFDWVMRQGVPDKGRVLTALSQYWFDWLEEPNHLLSTDVEQMDLPDDVDLATFAGRTTLCLRTEVIPIECVVRGYLSGSGWAEYQRSGMVCGVTLPEHLRESDRLPEPIFTPSTKEEAGHDINITFDQMVERVGADVADELRRRSISVYRRGAEHALERGIIIADTKFEWGVRDGEILLIDEVLTPDSSRFWPADAYRPGGAQASFDKQFVRDWLSASGWDKNSSPPDLPDEVIAGTRAKYVEAYERLTGETFH